MSKEREQDSDGGRRGVVVHEVEEVYIYIPAEISAAGFELKIAGVVRVEDKVSCTPDLWPWTHMQLCYSHFAYELSTMELGDII